ncbi:Glycosyl transferase family 2 [Brevinema andersonii]|uniref:Glycosyl transferase family 2 n=1 Tax=Brevinema andersonii TaxID=34097 RepID=A0A1I1EY76_BREAD|nr:glycosyltransferase [Brevinema andersonii]SFB92095.1 Glycosyl transferase family 2 [Brevinema andersonii]
MFDLTKELDIILITYNRKEKLSNMLQYIFAENSPIKECCITVLDNCSTDGTSALLQEYAANYSNFVHIRHKHNIGGNANIIRAFETISLDKTYFWILCDDDYVDWTYWAKIEQALMSLKYDIVQVHSDVFIPDGNTEKEKTAKSLVELVLIPAAIYKTKYINSEMLFYAYLNLYTKIPHMSLIASIVNQKKNIYRCAVEEQILVKRHASSEFGRGVTNQNVNHISQRIDLPVGFAISLSMLKDKELKTLTLNLSRAYLGWNFEGYMKDSLYGWISCQYNDDLMAVYNACNNAQKKKIYQIIYQMYYEITRFSSKEVGASRSESITFQIRGIKRSLKDILKSVISLFLSVVWKSKQVYKNICNHLKGEGNS